MANPAAVILGLWNFPVGAVLTVLVAALFLGTLLWKIIRSDEGFLLGYGNWVFGKWQNSRDSPGGPCIHEHHYHHHSHRNLPQICTHHEVPPDCIPSESGANRQARERAWRTATEALRFSRTLDTDLAFLLARPPAEWAAEISRHCQTLISGIPRVIRPGCRCRCGFFVPDSQGRELVLVVGEGFKRRPRLTMESCAGRAFRTGEPYYCKDIVTDPVYWHSASDSREFRSIACVPVRAGRTVFGVICLDAERVNAFTSEDFSHLETFAAKLAVLCALHAMQVHCTFHPPTESINRGVG